MAETTSTAGATEAAGATATTAGTAIMNMGKSKIGDGARHISHQVSFKREESGNCDGDDKEYHDVEADKAGEDDKQNGKSRNNTNEISSRDDSINNSNERHWDQTSKKVIVHNILKFIRAKELDKLVASWLKGHEDLGIVITKTKKPPKDNWVKVTLGEEWMVEPFIKLINGSDGSGGRDGDDGGKLNRRGKTLFAKRASEVEESCARRDDRDNHDCNDRKRKQRDDNDTNSRIDNNSRDDKKSATMRILSNNEVRDVITPLWRMSYEEQLEWKLREMIRRCAMKIIQEIKSKFK